MTLAQSGYIEQITPFFCLTTNLDEYYSCILLVDTKYDGFLDMDYNCTFCICMKLHIYL